MKSHKLKTWPSYFEAIRNHSKMFEVRNNDRDFAVGDELVLNEWDPGKEAPIDDFKYTGRVVRTLITYVLHGGRFGIEKGYCVLGFSNIEEGKP